MMAYLYLFICALLVPIPTLAIELEKEDGVVVLTDENFQTIIDKYKHVMVKIYAPWCGHCKAMAPEYASAAKILAEQESEVIIAKLDGTVHKDVAAKMSVQGYPTVKFFISGKAIDFNGERKAKSIVDWIAKKTGPPAASVQDVDGLNKLKLENSVFVIGLVKSETSEIAQKYLEIASTPNDESVMYTIVKASDENAASLFSECGINIDSEAVIVFKQFDEGKAVLTDGLLDDVAVRQFISKHSLPLVVEFNQDTAQRIFGGDVKTHLILFLSYKDTQKFEEIKSSAEKVAVDHRGNMAFVTIDVDEPDHERITEFFGMEKSSPQGMRIIRLGEDMKKFKPDVDEMTESNIKQFVTDFFAGKIKQHLMTQEIPDDWDKNPVKILVGKNFDEVVNQKGKRAIVMFYAPWCGHCKALSPVWDELGTKYASNDEVIVAKLDSTANELENVRIDGFPTIKLFTKDTNQVVDFNGARTLEGLSKFIDSDGKDGAEVESSEGVDDDEDEDDGDEDSDHESVKDSKDEL